MGRYTLIKLLLIIPSLIVLSLFVFFLSKIAPGDPVASMVELRGQVTTEFNTGEISEEYAQVAKELSLDLPLFYFSIKPSYYPDTLYRVLHPQRKKMLKSWLHQNMNWDVTQQFVFEHQILENSLVEIPDSIINGINRRTYLKSLKVIENTSSLDLLNTRYNDLYTSLQNEAFFSESSVKPTADRLKTTIEKLSTPRRRITGVLPSIYFHGLNNQYHKWIAGIIRLDFGESVVDAIPALSKIANAIGWTLFYVLIAYIFSLLIAIPTGLFNAWNYGKSIEKFISSLSFIFYAFPLFWIATMAAMFLTNDLYANWLHLFPGTGIGNISSKMSIGQKLLTALPFLILPALILALHSAASGIRIVRNSAITELKSDYFLTAKAKGLNSMQLLWRHIFPNAMLPIITLLVSSFPAAITGSVVLEVIFNIPGMGRLLYDSILFMDWNVVFAILLIMGLITFIFYLIGDLLYAYLNPKIKYGIE